MKSATRTGSRFPKATETRPRARRKRPHEEHDKHMLELFKRIFGSRRGFEKHVIAHLHQLETKLEAIMATNAELLEKVAAIRTALAGIRQDITDIKNGLPAAGGLTSEEVETLRVALDEAVTDAAGLDAENPTPPAA